MLLGCREILLIKNVDSNNQRIQILIVFEGARSPGQSLQQTMSGRRSSEASISHWTIEPEGGGVRGRIVDPVAALRGRIVDCVAVPRGQIVDRVAVPRNLRWSNSVATVKTKVVLAVITVLYPRLWVSCRCYGITKGIPLSVVIGFDIIY